MDPVKQERDEEEQIAFLPGSSARHADEDLASDTPRRWRAAAWMRCITEVAMAVTIAILFMQPLPNRTAEKPSAVPTFPRKVYTFQQNDHYMNEEMFFSEKDTLHTLHNWLPLSSKSRGYVVLDDYLSYDLPDPYTVQVNRTDEGPGFMMTVFHQLHCLSYLVAHYQQGYAGVQLTDEVAHHTAHCFDYIRQGILCGADTNLEGKTEAGPGEGSPHDCKDYDAVLEWANAHAGMPWRNALLPDEAIL